jgi:hypothetical protein
MTTTLADLWQRTGRAARDDRKRLLCLYAVLAMPPTLLVAGALARLLTGAELALATMRRPVAYVFDPVREAWMHDDALGALLFVLVSAVFLAVPWGILGGAVSRMAAVDLAAGRRETPGEALAFARRHARGFVGAKATLWAGALVPAAVAMLAALLARLPGPLGTVGSVVAVVVVPALALAAVVAGSLGALAAWVAGPTIAAEDSDAFDAVSRVYSYAAAGLPRLLAVRLVFLGGVCLGATWRLLRTVATALVAGVALQAGAGRVRFDGWLSALGAIGTGRSVPVADLLPGLLLAAVAAGLAGLWLADLAARVICGRMGAYLWLRHLVDRVPTDRLRTAPAGSVFQDAEAAGFVEVARIGVPTKRPTR